MIDSSACIPVQKLLPIVLHSEPDRQSGYSQYCGGLPSNPSYRLAVKIVIGQFENEMISVDNDLDYQKNIRHCNCRR